MVVNSFKKVNIINHIAIFFQSLNVRIAGTPCIESYRGRRFLFSRMKEQEKLEQSNPEFQVDEILLEENLVFLGQIMSRLSYDFQTFNCF